MSLQSKIWEKYQNEGVSGVLRSAPPYIQRQALITADLPTKLAIRSRTCDIYEKPWDLLIILDACRYDIMEEVVQDYPFIRELQHTYSPASSSKEWLQHQFQTKFSKEIKRTSYITGNTFSSEVLSSKDFALLDEVWRYGWDEQTGTVLPRPITDRAISTARKNDPDRMVVHYMQPHFPSLKNPDLGGKVDPTENRWINSIWDQLANGEISYETAWDAYKSNLREVLSEVELLVNNTDFDRVVITADHGNGFGERGIYGHPSDRTHPCLRKVPWATTTATDSGEHTPKEYDRDRSEDSMEDKLAALGYI